MGMPEVSSAVVFGSLTMVSWGVWLVVGNAASESMDPVTAAAISYLVATGLAVMYVFFQVLHSLSRHEMGHLLAWLAYSLESVLFQRISVCHAAQRRSCRRLVLCTSSSQRSLEWQCSANR